MRIRSLVIVAGFAGTLVMTQLMASAFADPKSQSLTQAEQFLGAYMQTNQKVAACMKGKGLSYDARLAKVDVIDAFSTIPEAELTANLGRTRKSSFATPTATIGASRCTRCA